MKQAFPLSSHIAVQSSQPGSVSSGGNGSHGPDAVDIAIVRWEDRVPVSAVFLVSPIFPITPFHLLLGIWEEVKTNTKDQSRQVPHIDFALR